MKFTDLFVRRPVLALVVSTLILLLGARALVDLPVRQYPLTESTTLTITTQYPGASPELMQGFVTQPIAQAVATIENVDYLSSSSTLGRSVISVRMKLNADANQALTQAMAQVSQVKYRLPAEAFDPVILKSSGEATAVAYVGFSSKTMPVPQLTDYLSRVVQPQFASIEGVSGVEVSGGQTLAMRVWLDANRMAARGISAGELADALRQNNVQAAPGQVKGLYVVSNIRVNTDLVNVAEFRDMVIKRDGEAIVRLGDVATVELGAASADSSATMDGDKAIYLGLQAAPNGNPLVIVKRIRDLLPGIKQNLPPGVEVQLPFELARFIEASIDEVQKTLLEAIAIVVLVIFLCLGSLRAVLIPVVTIPLSMLGAAALMLLFGFSINLLTLLAMVLAIGLVVDDAIVVVENVHRHIEEGKSRVQAALIGAREVAGPVIAMTLTLAAVYAPIGLMGGLTGSLFKEFAFTLAGAVVVSGVIALTLSPVMSSFLLPQDATAGRMARYAEAFFHKLATAYGRLLGVSLHHRWVTGLLAAAVLVSLPFFVQRGAARAGARRGPGDGDDRHQVAAARQHRLRREVRPEVGRGAGQAAREHRSLAHQRLGRRLQQHRRRAAVRLERSPAQRRPDPGRRAGRHERGRGQQRVRLSAAVASRFDRRASGADGDPQRGRPPQRVRGDGNAEEGGARERQVRRGRQRPGVQQPRDRGARGPRQGQQHGRDHEGHRRHAGRAGGRELRQPLRHGRALVRRDSAVAA